MIIAVRYINGATRHLLAGLGKFVGHWAEIDHGVSLPGKTVHKEHEESQRK